MELQVVIHETLQAVKVILLLLLVLTLRNLIYFKIQQHRVKWGGENTPTLPYVLPLLKSTIPFLFNGMKLLTNGSLLFREKSAIRIALLNDDLYLVHGSKNITELFRTAQLTVNITYGIVLKYCFGLKEEAVQSYISDTSGSQKKPIEDSHVTNGNRVSYITHENLLEGFLGSGLEPTCIRFEKSLEESWSSMPIFNEWQEFPDLRALFEGHMGLAVIKSIFGSKIIDQHPHLVHDLWEYDKVIICLAKRIPKFWLPEAYRLRDKLVLCVKEWHQSVRRHICMEPGIHNASFDEIWGSKMIRERYELLTSVKGQDADSVASADLGLLWATVTNVVPSSMTLALHAFGDQELLAEIKKRILNRPKVDYKLLEKDPLLLSMYAETLRFGVQIHIPRCSPHRPLTVGNSFIPRNKLILVDTWLAHTDESSWNTRDLRFPLENFWPQRFLVDPKDTQSGPVNPSNSHKHPISNKSKDIYYSTDGLEGAWIPYGGGHHACPGRILAKRFMLISFAMLATVYDIEILGQTPVEFCSPRFGFGVRKPKNQVPFRIRRKVSQEQF